MPEETTKLKLLGRLAYEGYRESSEGKSTGTLPDWSELPELIQKAWENAAYKVYQWTRSGYINKL